MTPGPAERVRITSPRTAGARTRRRSVAAEIDAQTRIGEVYVQSLVRSQLRLALGVVALLTLTLGALPLVFVVFPAVRRFELLEIPVPWLVLGGLVYPFLIAVGWAYTRRAERNEQDFADLLRADLLRADLLRADHLRADHLGAPLHPRTPAPPP